MWQALKDGKNLDSGRVGLGLFGITIPRNGRNKCDQIDSREGFLLGKLGESTGQMEDNSKAKQLRVRMMWQSQNQKCNESSIAHKAENMITTFSLMPSLLPIHST